jgi:hypothetical protein
MGGGMAKATPVAIARHQAIDVTAAKPRRGPRVRDGVLVSPVFASTNS